MFSSRLRLLCLLVIASTLRASDGPVFRLTTASPAQRVDDLLQRLTVEEKVALCHGIVGSGPEDRFFSGGVPRLGIDRLSFRDGPVGVRTFDRSPATALPSTIALAATWNVDSARDYGRVLAEEMQASHRNVLFGPGVDLMRDPRGGRNFEYLGEDPFLAGTLAVEYIRAVQARGIAADAKHLVANDYETRRHFTSANLDERTLREMHFLPFEMAVRDGNVWTIMTANSLVNGTHVSANRDILQTLLKDRIGFDGVVLTDWRAAYDTVPTALAGTDMTTGLCAYVFGEGRLLEAVTKGDVPMAVLDDKVRRILMLYLRTGLLDPTPPAKAGALDTPEHRATARRLAAEGMVLLKNEGNLLPLDMSKVKSIFVTGPGAEYVAFGRGSGQVHSAFRTTPLAGIKAAAGDAVSIVHAPWPAPAAERGPKAPAQPPHQLSVADLSAAKNADVVLFFATDTPHGEGGDLADLDLPGGQPEAIAALAKQNRRVVLILQSGQPVMLQSFIADVPVVLAGWYLGQAAGDAIADVMTGKTSPSGRLNATFAKRIDDYPCETLGLWPPRPIVDRASWDAGMNATDRHATYGVAADYRECVFIGYRWFDEKKLEPLFPFGHGLSFTTFEFSDLKITRGAGGLGVSCRVKNTGNVASAEVVQVYIAPPASTRVPRPPRELKGFAKVWLQPGESKQVDVPLRASALSYFDAKQHRWQADAGTYSIEVGHSSRDLALRAPVVLEQETHQDWY